MNKVADASPCRDLLVRVDAGTAGRNPTGLRDSGHFSKYQAGASHAQVAEMDKMKIAGDAAWFGRIHVHRRDYYAVLHDHSADAKRREHWRRRLVERNVKALSAQ